MDILYVGYRCNITKKEPDRCQNTCELCESWRITAIIGFIFCWRWIEGGGNPCSCETEVCLAHSVWVPSVRTYVHVVWRDHRAEDHTTHSGTTQQTRYKPKTLNPLQSQTGVKKDYRIAEVGKHSKHSASRVTDPCVPITSHFISTKWELMSKLEPLLQTG